MKFAATAIDWTVRECKDGTLYFECGGVDKAYHMAFDTALNADTPGDIEIAQRFVAAMNLYNEGV